MGDYINSITIKLKNLSDMELVRDDLRNQLSKIELPEESYGFEVLGWNELMPEIVQFIVMDDVGAYIFDFILFMVVAFGILNTIQMSVFERIREFGVMLAIGTRPGQLISMILCESFFITTIGIVLGCGAGAGISYYLNKNPIDYSAYADEIQVYGINTLEFPADMTMLNLGVTVAVTLLLGLLFTIAPARYASKLKPIEAIRHL